MWYKFLGIYSGYYSHWRSNTRDLDYTGNRVGIVISFEKFHRLPDISRIIHAEVAAIRINIRYIQYWWITENKSAIKSLSSKYIPDILGRDNEIFLHYPYVGTLNINITGKAREPILILKWFTTWHKRISKLIRTADFTIISLWVSDSKTKNNNYLDYKYSRKNTYTIK